MRGAGTYVTLGVGHSYILIGEVEAMIPVRIDQRQEENERGGGAHDVLGNSATCTSFDFAILAVDASSKRWAVMIMGDR